MFFLPIRAREKWYSLVGFMLKPVITFLQESISWHHQNIIKSNLFLILKDFIIILFKKGYKWQNGKLTFVCLHLNFRRKRIEEKYLVLVTVITFGSLNNDEGEIGCTKFTETVYRLHSGVLQLTTNKTLHFLKTYLDRNLENIRPKGPVILCNFLSNLSRNAVASQVAGELHSVT